MLGTRQGGDAECMTKGVILPDPCPVGSRCGCAGGGSGGLLELSQLGRHWCWQLVGLGSKGKET